MSNFTYDQKIAAILEWAEDNEEFDTDFIESVQQKAAKFGGLTKGQQDAIDSIIEKFRIDVDLYTPDSIADEPEDLEGYEEDDDFEDDE